MNKIKKFIKSHFQIDLYWGHDIWHIIPTIALIYHPNCIGISFSIDWLKLNFWSIVTIKSVD